MSTAELNYTFLILLFVVAFLYASVGHGGASGYLALMALFGFAPAIMKSSALLLNVFVSLIAFIQYYRGGYFKWKLFYPFAIISIPAAFLGAYITVDPGIYKKMLSILLLFPILRLSGFPGEDSEEHKEINLPAALVIGGVIGILSGMIGIGGGILLSPVILLLHWGNMKQTAAVSALFIFVNSIAGVISLFIKGTSFGTEVYLWLIVAIAGGFLGSYLGARNFNSIFLKWLLAIVLLIASVKLFMVQ